MTFRTLLLAWLALPGPLLPLAAAPATPPSAPATLTTTLAELGYSGGFVFDGVSLPAERTLLFRLPSAMPITAATLRLRYHGSAHLDPTASLRVVINDLPAQEQSLVPDPAAREWLLPIPQEFLDDGQLKVTVRGNLPLTYPRRREGEPQRGGVHVSEESGLVSHQKGWPGSLRDAWLTLPEEVVVTIPVGRLDEATFKAALDWVTLLQRHHHTVRITTLPQLGHLVIAPEVDVLIAMARAGHLPVPERSLWNSSGNNIGVVSVQGRSFIAATPPYPDPQRFHARWEELSGPLAISSEPIAPPHPPPAVLPLDGFGLSTAGALLGDTLQWSATITPRQLPPGTRPDAAAIHFALPTDPSRRKVRIFIYLNDTMIRSELLAADGTEQELAISFRSVPRRDTYRLRVVAREAGKGDALLPAAPMPIRITSQSHLTLRSETRPVAGLSSMPTALGDGFDLYVPRAYLSSADRYLPLLGRLLSGFAPPQTPYRILVLNPGRRPSPQRNYLVANDAPLGEVPPPLRFDAGKVRLVDPHGATLIGEQQLRQTSVLQLVRQAAVVGLWLRPGDVGGAPLIDADRLGRDDVALYDADHLLLSIDSHQEDLVYADYLDAPPWHERLYRQRFWWLLLAWALLTAGVYYLYLKSRQHRNG